MNKSEIVFVIMIAQSHMFGIDSLTLIHKINKTW